MQRRGGAAAATTAAAAAAANEVNGADAAVAATQAAATPEWTFSDAELALGVLLDRESASAEMLQAFSEQAAARAARKFASLAEFETAAAVRRGSASIDRNNCLLSSAAQAAGLVHPSHIEAPPVLDTMQRWREKLHDGISPQLEDEEPPESDESVARWDTGFSKSIADDIHRDGCYLRGSHASAVAQQLGRPIVVVQLAGRDGEQAQMASCGEEGYLSATIYPPHLAKPHCDVDKKEVMSMVDGRGWGSVVGIKPPLLIYLEGGHYSPLLTHAQRNAGVFSPGKLMNEARGTWPAPAS